MRGAAFLLTAILGCGMAWGTSQTQKKSSTATGKKKAPPSRKKSKSLPRSTQPDAQRSREIQEALKEQGYLKSEPSGKWDAATIAAFARYQQDHGRKTTGKPDALSLKDLGLGSKY